MIALREEFAPDAEDREAERSMQTVYPLQTVFEHRAWTMDSWALPIPDLCRRLVRDGRTWRLTVHAAIQRYEPPRMGMAERKARAKEYREFMDTLMLLGPDSQAFGRLVLQLFSVARCGFKGCREPYLRYAPSVRHCCDDCRRAAWEGPAHGTGAERRADCDRCGTPLTGRQRRYCGPACARGAGRDQKRALEQAQRRAAGVVPRIRSATCDRCGAPVTGRRLRYCSAECERTAWNARRAALTATKRAKGETA